MVPTTHGVGHYTFPITVLNAVPATGNATLLSTAYNRKLKASLMVTCEQFDMPEDRRLMMRSAILALDPAVKHHPSLYRLYFQCLAAIEGHRQAPINELLEVLLDGRPQELAVEPAVRAGWQLRDVMLPFEASPPAGAARLRFSELEAEQFETQRQRVVNALDNIAELDASFSEEIQRFVSRIYLFSGETVVGLTSPDFHGAMFLSSPRVDADDDDDAYYIEHIVHETSHMYLNTVLAFDRLLHNGPEEIFDAPIRADKRPLLGVLHATFVLFRIVRTLKAFCERGGSRVGQARQLLSDRQRRFEKGLEVLDRHARFSPWGLTLFRSMQ